MKEVPSEIYDKEYYLGDCSGFKEFSESDGKILEGRLKKLLEIANIKEGDDILDFGCGRGEIVLHSAIKKANVIGIDYSEDAIALAKKITKDYKNVKLIHGGLEELKRIDRHFNVIFLVDVVEHISKNGLFNIMKELKRLLKPDGMIIIHTAPNKIFVKYGYRMIYIINKILGKENLKFDLRSESEKVMHINEQTKYSLKKLAKKLDLNHIIWLRDTNIAENYSSGKLLKSFVRGNEFFMNNLYAVFFKKNDIKQIGFPSDYIFTKGWYDSEGTHRWSMKESEITLLSDNIKKISVTVTGIQDEQKLSIIQKKNEIQTIINKNNKKIYINVTSRKIKFKSNLDFIPSEISESNDNRNLSFHLTEITAEK